MKRIGYLFEKVCDMGNLRLADINAGTGKGGRQEVAKFRADLEHNLAEIRAQLLGKTYNTSTYTCFVKHEPKERLIFKLPYRDRVVQWAIMQVLVDIWTPIFTRDTYACIKGRGVHALLAKLRKDLREDIDGTKYCYKIDIRKFYPSITHSILKEVVRQRIKDPDLLWLLDNIIDSADGVPIGNYISQYFANLYLAELDHIVKEQWNVKYYYRYADDIVILSPSKEFLHDIHTKMVQYLREHRRLELKPNWQIFPVEARGIDYVGYVTRHSYCRARKRNKKALCKIVAKLRHKGLTGEEIRLRVASRLGFIVHADSKHLINILGVKKLHEVKKSQGSMIGDKYHIDRIIGREIHLLRFELTPSKMNTGDCLKFQYELQEQLVDDKGQPLMDKGLPVMGWVKHITFTGSKTLAEDMADLDLSEPVQCQVVRQKCVGSNRCFYKLAEWEEPKPAQAATDPSQAPQTDNNNQPLNNN
jgi:hypothetical protein